MASGPNRRTFLRGAAGVAGLGAVGALSSKLDFARASEPRGDLRDAHVEIPVDLVSIRRRGRPPKKVLVCPDAQARKDQDVLWYDAGTSSLTISLVQFKEGSTPFDDVDLPTPMAANRVRNNAAGRYSYLIVARDGNNRTYALDPDLDII